VHFRKRVSILVLYRSCHNSHTVRGLLYLSFLNIPSPTLARDVMRPKEFIRLGKSSPQIGIKSKIVSESILYPLLGYPYISTH
jgi:hypothetical protein